MEILSQEQQAAVNTREGYWACHAGPGSGKTAVLIKRHKALCDFGIAPQDIISLTFTEKAAEEMRIRTAINTAKIYETRPYGFRTFHSLALTFANSEKKYFSFKLADDPLAHEGISRKILKAIISKYPGLSLRECKEFIGQEKRNGIRPASVLAFDIKRTQFKSIYQEYQKELRGLGLLDFDDLMLEMVHLIENNNDLRDFWSYKFIQVDESQDCNEIDWDFLELISKKHGNLFMVGDNNQCIFQFRGARPDLFANFGKVFPTGKSLYLSGNFRSSPAIVDFIRDIAPQKNELITRLHAETDKGRPNGYGPEPTIKEYASSNEEAKGIVEHYEKAEGVDSTAILCRTNAALRAFEDNLNNHNLKYHLLKKTGFFRQPEIVYVLKHAKQIKNSKVSAGETLQKIIKERHVVEYYTNETEIAADSDPIANLVELVHIASKFNDLRTFLIYVQRISRGYERKSGLALGTIHSSKGLEWKSVYIAGIQEGILPHQKSDNIDEEARILFVACSRAAVNLHLSYVGEPSRFLRQVVQGTQNVLQ